VFLKSEKRKELLEWYRDRLGVPVLDWGGAVFSWEGEDQPSSRPGQTVWSIFPVDSDYFGESGQRAMLNFRVRDLETMLAQLKEAGENVDERTETSEFGAFGWVTDPEGNRVELWQPPDQE
jgi:predicted enzyme related to lactoylglutathione lyase